MKEIFLKCGAATLVSDVDYDWLREFKWRANYHTASGKPYVCTSIKKKTVYMQRLITKCPPTYKADHWDRNTLNNQRSNLRIASFLENNANRQGFGQTGYKGVSPARNGYRARITFEGDSQYLGTFATARDAAKAYDAAAHNLFGEFAYLNFPEDYPPPTHDIPTFEEIPF